MKFITILVLSLSLVGTALGCSEDGSSGFLPENDMNIPANAKVLGGITEEEFNAVIDKYEAIYAPIVKDMGGNLKVNRLWENGTVNANATRLGGWIVNMYGGLARHEKITADGFALVVCHEIGHHLGGAPKVDSFPWIMKWASNEGQSDYFATLKCLRKGFLNDDNAAIVSRMVIPTTLATSCAKAFNNNAEKNICIRAGMAGVSVAGLFASMRNAPAASFDTPDSNVVKKTDHAHPAHQCRLDTYFQGAICDKSFNEDVSQKDEVQGTCHGSTGYESGVRPLCWFKPKK